MVASGVAEVEEMNEIAVALVNLITGNAVIQAFGVRLYFGPAPTSAEYPYITYLPTDDVPRQLHTDADATATQAIVETHWDFKVWGPDAEAVGNIYQALIDIFNTSELDGYVGLKRGNGMPMIPEENRPDDIIYSRMIECSVFKEE